MNLSELSAKEITVLAGKIIERDLSKLGLNKIEIDYLWAGALIFNCLNSEAATIETYLKEKQEKSPSLYYWIDRHRNFSGWKTVRIFL